jgi:hypothetical protein
MFIEGLKIIPQDGETPRLWRFRNDQGSHRNICVIQASDGDQQLLMAALRWGFGGSKDPRIKAVLIHLTDNDGDAWIIDRSVDQFRSFKNRQVFDGRPEFCLKEMFKDYVSAQTQDAVSLSDVLREYDVSFDGKALQAFPKDLSKIRKSAIERQGALRAEELRQNLQTLLGLEQSPSPTQMELLLQHGEGLMRRCYGLKQQAREIGGASAHLNQLDTSLSHKLEQELTQLEHIQVAAQPLFEPSRSPKVLKERLQEIDRDLQQLCDRLEIKVLPLPESDVDWSAVLQSLTRYLAYEKLEKSARKSVQDARSMIKPAYDEYRVAVSRFLQIDRDLIRELEQCLTELGDQVRRSEAEDGRQKDGIASKLNKLLGWQARDGEQPGQPAPSGAQQLDLSRSAVNLCLNQIAKLYADLERHAELHDEKLQDLDDRYEKVVVEYGKAREHWLGMSRKAQLPAETSLRSLINYINNYSNISLLYQKRTKIEDELQSYRNQVKTLGRMLQDWRTHTGSQKSLTLDNNNIILAEARGVLQYAAKKKLQLQKIRGIESKQEALKQLRERIDQYFTQLSARWSQLLEQLGWSDRPLPTEQWSQIQAAGIEWLGLEKLLSEGSKALKNEQIFAASTLDHPVIVYHWKTGIQGNKARIALLQQLELSDDSGLALFLTEDAALVEMIQKLGVSLGTASAPKLTAPPPLVQKPTKTVISEKARVALEIFATKQGKGSHENF